MFVQIYKVRALGLGAIGFYNIKVFDLYRKYL
jgi:hypothetical protein